MPRVPKRLNKPLPFEAKSLGGIVYRADEDGVSLSHPKGQDNFVVPWSLVGYVDPGTLTDVDDHKVSFHLNKGQAEALKTVILRELYFRNRPAYARSIEAHKRMFRWVFLRILPLVGLLQPIVVGGIGFFLANDLIIRVGIGLIVMAVMFPLMGRWLYRMSVNRLQQPPEPAPEA